MAAPPRSLTALLRRRRAPPSVPEPPLAPPPGRLAYVPGRGELFLRDTGGDGRAVLLLHGWMVSADLNWLPVYDTLARAGYRVLAPDHRGHGRGLRTPEAFTLRACADDAAALIRHERIEPVLAVGYSMGGPIASLLAREHRELVAGLVLCATAPDWQEAHMRRLWRAMVILRLTLGLFPIAAWRAGLRRTGLPDTPGTTWVAAELTRASARAVPEAGREQGRYDGRSWLGALGVPAAVIVTSADRDVAPAKQRELAELLGVRAREVPGAHLAVSTHTAPFVAALLEALAELEARLGCR